MFYEEETQIQPCLEETELKIWEPSENFQAEHTGEEKATWREILNRNF